jgi:hypothetical protein
VATKKKPRTAVGCLTLLVLGVLVVIIIVAIVNATKSPPPSHPAKVAAFNSYVGTISNGLAYCNAATEDVQVELSQFLQAGNSATQAQLDELDSAAQKAQSPCDNTQDNALLNIETASVPGALSGQSSLENVGPDSGQWATDTGKVLHDIENLVQASGNTTGQQATLQSDIQSADADRASLNSDFQNAANSLGISYKGLGLTQWSS